MGFIITRSEFFDQLLCGVPMAEAQSSRPEGQEDLSDPLLSLIIHLHQHI